MKLKINKKQIIDQILNPISRIVDDCAINVTKNTINSLVAADPGPTVLYAETQMDNNTLSDTDSIGLNIKGVKKLIRVFECIPTDEFEIEIGDNNSSIKYSSTNLSFKLHLVLDDAIKKCTLSLNKINKLTYDTSFSLTNSKINEILKGSMFANESNKVYFFTKDKVIYAELTDKAIEQVDNITFNITPTYQGIELTTPLPFSVEILRLLSNNKEDVEIKINNSYKIILFEIKKQTGILKYIIPAYVK